MNGTYGDYLYAGRFVDTVTQHDPSTPLFYYLALQCAHMPMQAPKRFTDLYDPAVVPNVVEYAFSSVIDEAVGNVTKVLKAKGMWEKTLMVVSADNGGPAFSDQAAASNFPLRGGKYTLWEGGLRVSAFVTGGFLPRAMRGINISAPIHICDWYATFSLLAGVSAADDHAGVPSIDALDQWSVLSNTSAPAVRAEIYPASGILLQGRWKLVATGAGHAQWSGPLYPKDPATGPDSLSCNTKVPCLFDIIADAGEHNDVSNTNTDVVKVMSARLAVLDATQWSPTVPSVPPTGNAGSVCNATLKAGGYLTPSDWIPSH
jgi:arylsulfatase I/J